MILSNFKISQKTTQSVLTNQDWLSIFLILILFLFVFPITAFILVPALYCSKIYMFLSFTFEVNSLSSVFSILTIFIFYIGILANWNLLISKFSFKLNFNLFIFLISNICAFCSSTVFTFYFFFELTTLPILYFLTQLGKRNRKTKATQLFLVFTLLGSVCMFSVVFLDSFNAKVNPLLVICLLTIAFFIKLPVFPFYIWLPEAHVESPTIGSIFLAGISLKLGGFGIYRFLVPLLENFEYQNSYLILTSTLIFFSIFFSSIAALAVHDFKKIIAYSSISHMGLFSLNLILVSAISKIGSIVGMVAHSLTACALFFIAGIIYDKTKSRNTLYLSGLTTFMPVCSSFLLINILANISFPGSFAFVSELIIYYSILKLSPFILAIYILLSLFIAAFSFKLIKLFYFGNISSYSKFKITDLNRKEFVILLYLTVPQFYFGIFPANFLDILSNC